MVICLLVRPYLRFGGSNTLAGTLRAPAAVLTCIPKDRRYSELSYSNTWSPFLMLCKLARKRSDRGGGAGTSRVPSMGFLGREHEDVLGLVGGDLFPHDLPRRDQTKLQRNECPRSNLGHSYCEAAEEFPPIRKTNLYARQVGKIKTLSIRRAEVLLLPHVHLMPQRP